MAVKTNMLYDALLVPNIGVEFYVGKNWSLAGNWMYAWWKSDRHHNYWRLYGGDLEVRRWFGRKASENRLQGITSVSTVGYSPTTSRPGDGLHGRQAWRYALG